MIPFASGQPDKIYVEDVFGINLRTGTGAAASVTGMPNLATYGGMVSIKARDDGVDGNPSVFNTSRGTSAVANVLWTNSTTVGGSYGNQVTAYNSNGFSLGNDSTALAVNKSGKNYVDWVWRNAPKFFKETVVTKSAGVASTVDLSSLGVVGMVKVKSTTTSGAWYVWHRSLTAGKLLYGQATNAETTDSSISVSGTTLTLAAGLAADIYHIEAYAHDTSADGLIQCGSYVGNGSADGPAVSLGWEVQYASIKNITSAGDGISPAGWILLDTMRGWQNSSTASSDLVANSVQSEKGYSGGRAFGYPTATGFKMGSDVTYMSNFSGHVYIYVAIRRGPMKPPTSGTQVYQAIAYTGDGVNNKKLTGLGFAPDWARIDVRNDTFDTFLFDRLRGGGQGLNTTSTAAEGSYTHGIASFDMDGITFGSTASSGSNANTFSYIMHCLRRYPGVFDQVCYSGTSTTGSKNHNLGVAPEFIIVKDRNGGGALGWYVWHKDLAAGLSLKLNTTDIPTNTAYFGSVSATAITLAGNNEINGSTYNYTAYLFATLAGISKVGSYTGNGATGQIINCGFSSGARFVLIKQTNSTGSWFVFDSTRGIVAANDPYLQLNSTAAEDGTADPIDPHATGFQLPSNSLNELGATYIYLAFA